MDRTNRIKTNTEAAYKESNKCISRPEQQRLWCVKEVLGNNVCGREPVPSISTQVGGNETETSGRKFSGYQKPNHTHGSCVLHTRCGFEEEEGSIIHLSNKIKVYPPVPESGYWIMRGRYRMTREFHFSVICVAFVRKKVGSLAWTA